MQISYIQVLIWIYLSSFFFKKKILREECLMWCPYLCIEPIFLTQRDDIDNNFVCLSGPNQKHKEMERKEKKG